MAIPAVVSKTRRRNFQHLVATRWNGHRSVVAQYLEFKDPSLVTRYMSEGKSAKPIGNTLARKIEAVIGEAEGWMDVPHDDAAGGPPAQRGTIDERIRALPEPLRQYVLMELDVCERIQHLAPTEFIRAPNIKNRRAFQDYLQSMLGQPGGKRSAA